MRHSPNTWTHKVIQPNSPVPKIRFGHPETHARSANEYRQILPERFAMFH